MAKIESGKAEVRTEPVACRRVLTDAITKHGVLRSGVAFVDKPFTASMLGRKIREVLDN